MPAGMQIWDEQGRLMVDTNTRLSQVLGSFSIGDNSPAGSLVDGNLANGTPFVAVISHEGPKTDGSNGLRLLPQAWVSGPTTISWSAGDSAFILYGIY